MNDADAQSAPAGSRVGFALKGIEAKEVKRGAVFANTEDSSVKTAKEFDCEISVAKFARAAIENEAVLHLSAGLQFEPCAVRCTEAIKPGFSSKAKIVVDKPIALYAAREMVLCDLNAKALRVLAGVKLA
jgi:selenocysteine-specific translation elongation factor